MPKNKKSSPENRSYLVLILVFLFIIALGTVVYKSITLSLDVAKSSIPISPDNTELFINSNTTHLNENSDWKTYVNEDPSFSFKYPSEWYYENVPGFPTEETPVNISFFLTSEKVLHTTGDLDGNEVLIINLTENASTIEELKEKYYTDADIIVINGNPALRTSFGLIITKVGNAHTLRISRGVNVIDQILESFDF